VKLRPEYADGRLLKVKSINFRKELKMVNEKDSLTPEEPQQTTVEEPQETMQEEPQEWPVDEAQEESEEGPTEREEG
jgi:hypothetical protein